MVRSINKTDVANMVSNFQSFAGIARATKEELSNCPGMGDKKVADRARAAVHPTEGHVHFVQSINLTIIPMCVCLSPP